MLQQTMLWNYAQMMEMWIVTMDNKKLVIIMELLWKYYGTIMVSCLATFGWKTNGPACCFKKHPCLGNQGTEAGENC